MGDLNHWAKGDRIGIFTVQRLLGRGFEAVVYLVRDGRDGKLRTLKLFKRTNILADVEHTFKHWQRYMGLEGVKQCLELGALTGQRRVSTRPWLLGSYTPGMTLAEKIERGRICDPTALTTCLLQAMVPIHARGLSLGDLDKGRNVVVERGTGDLGRLVFIDFDAGSPGYPPPHIYEDLLEVLWLARRCSGAELPVDLVKALTEAPNAVAALSAIARLKVIPAMQRTRSP